MISDEQITKFMELHQNRFGTKLSREEAYESATKLIQMMKSIYKPMSAKEYQKVQQRRKETKDL